ncbi:aldo/keto reductase [Rubripirellula reticaptiva]|uniref:Pyridoxal 4-dehydrogenase n=1 Tax=Rubripirellula reticaptiva TaxID=2528013 RepID=A0A5C6EEQ1_9BACT|nr:aldo/keto reductase [Rubripirellula reticaptiva]TWU46894.1 Pyridoxal 4-dehydrogenase [Rubripirellula reticaptiva]
MPLRTTTSPSTVGKPVLQLPRIVFGTSALGNLYQAIDDTAKREIVSQWFENVPDVVAADSAGKYGAGLALESMAKALSDLAINPDRILISNKLGWRRVPMRTPEPTFEPGAWVDLKHDAVQDISYDGILRCYHQGCELLAPYRPQMVSVHDPDEYLAGAVDDADREKRWDDVVGAYQALTELRERGEVSAIGVGSKDWKTSMRLTNECKLDWVMLATSLTIYTHPPELLAFVRSLYERGIPVINSAVFHAGFLTGGAFFDYRKVTGESAEDQELIHWRTRFYEVCDRYSVRPAEACVAFGMSPPGVVATALNSSRPGRIAENVHLCRATQCNEFWLAMKDAKLIDRSYPYLGTV